MGRMQLGKLLRWAIVIACFCIGAALVAAAWFHFSKPTVLTVAVGPPEFDDAALMAAFGRRLVASGSSLRLSIVPSSGPVEALERLAKGEAQVAVVRSDGAGSSEARAVALLHSDPVVVITAEKNGIESYADLKGKKLGVIGPPGANDALIAGLRKRYNAPGETRSFAPNPAEVAAAIRDRTVDA